MRQRRAHETRHCHEKQVIKVIEMNTEKNNCKESNKELLKYISDAPSIFHAAAASAAMLEEAGYRYLREADRWEIAPGGRYYTMRNASSVIAFTVAKEISNYKFRIAASHSDSPTYKIKAVPALSGPEGYVRLNVEAYGGMIDFTWLDRPLGMAGRVFVKNGQRVEARLYRADNVLLIPSLAIHMNREVNKGMAFNRQVDLCPLFSAGALKAEDFTAFLATGLGVDKEEIVSFDLYLVNMQEGLIWGAAEEFISSPKLDDLQCAFTTLKGLLAAQPTDGVNVWCCFDNEEVGSNTRQGAMSTFLKECLKHINAALGYDEEDYYRAVAGSFLVSADNAHAVHPNHPEKTDAENKCALNKGIVIKENASQKYTTDAMARAAMKAVCALAGQPCQVFANRSDAAGGSTLGNLSNTQVSLHAVDVGLPQLAMHSAYETAGAEDTYSAIRVFEKYYSAAIEMDEAAAVTVR